MEIHKEEDQGGRRGGAVISAGNSKNFKKLDCVVNIYHDCGINIPLLLIETMKNLFNITKSGLRKKTLLYFFSNPQSSLYVREIAQILNVDVSNLAKELSRLEEEGIFVSNLRGNQKYFTLDKTYPLYNELRSIVSKTIGFEGGIKALLNNMEGILCAFIYGSFAQGKEHPQSDIDLLIIGSPNEDKLLEKIDAFEKKLGREINYNIYPLAEFKNKRNGNDSFIANVLKREKIMLKGDINEI